MDELYTEEIRKHIYQVKARLPKDYLIVTTERDYPHVPQPTIIIIVDIKDFDRRTVEDRLAIALELEQLKTNIRESGVACLIEKTG